MTISAAQAAIPPAADTNSRLRRLIAGRRWAVWASGLFAVFVFGATLVSSTNAGYDMDMRLYISKALELGGTSHDQAIDQAAKAFCTGSVLGDNKNMAIDQWAHNNPREVIKSCVSDAVGIDTGWSPRYLAIFNARIGVPLLYMPFVTVLGAFWGMWAGAGTIAAACGLLANVLVRLLGGSRAAGLAAQVLFAILPVGFMTGRPMAEGPQYLVVLTTLCGAAMLLRGRPRTGAAVLLVGLAMTAAVKDSTAMILGAMLAAGAGIHLLSARTRSRLWAVLGGIGVVGLLGTYAWSHLRHNPGLTATVQDLLTGDFGSPDVKDPWTQLLHWEGRFWPWEVARQVYQPQGLVLLAVTGWALWRRSRPAQLIAAIPLVIAIISVAAHPAASEAGRIGATAWLTCIIGLALALDEILHRRNPAAEKAEEADGVSTTPLAAPDTAHPLAANV